MSYPVRVEESPNSTPRMADKEPQGGPSWADTQGKLSADAGQSLLLVEGFQPPALVTSNNNSICQTIQSSHHAPLCAPFCGEAHKRAQENGGVIEYRCHAGLHCFAAPVEIGGKKNLTVIGGRAFLEIADYKSAIARFRDGDLKDIFAEETFSNVIFSTEGKLSALASRLERTVRDFNRALPTVENIEIPLESSNGSNQLEREVERLRNQVEHQKKFAHSLQYFLEQISSTNPHETYLAVLMNSKELLHAERASLLVYDEATDQLTVKAAVGIPANISDVSSMRLGEGISGETLQLRKPVMVADLEAAGLKAAPAERRYKTKSFISYPITIGGRRVGVLNLTDKTGGGAYDAVDLNLLEIVVPQVALALERAEWQEKASLFQLMSITDPLTSLPNRRYLEERLSEEVNRSRRYEQPLSFLMIDIDDFKLYNDRNGHQAGDLALQVTAQELKAALRAADVASRYGGEEFSVLLPQTTLAEAGVIAERMRDRIERTHFPHAKSQPLGAVTISVGVSTFTPTINTAEQIIWAADRALYSAKHEGKNRISFYQTG